MELLICWVAYPLLLAAVAQGCGALVALAAARPLPATVRLPCGIALAMAVLDIATYNSATARLAVPAVAVLTVAGLVLSAPRPHRPSSALSAALIAFAAYAAPIVLSGMATWGGYIKLEDTAVWLGLVDQALTHGHSIAGLAPSTYQLTLAQYLTVGYPLGSFLPLGLGHVFLGQDIAWLSDPWMAFMGAMLALALHRIASRALPTSAGWQRALIAGIAAQPALLYGYYLWGGMKEMAGAMLVGAFAVTAPLPLSGERRLRALVPVAVVVWAEIASLSAGGLVWLGPGLVLAALLAAAASRRELPRLPWRPLPGVPAGAPSPHAPAGAPSPHAPAGAPSPAAAARVLHVVRQPVVLAGAAVAVVGGVGAYLVFRPGGFVERFHAVLTGGDQFGALVTPLSVEQLAGIWPTGDFRYAPMELTLTRALVVIAVVGAVVGLVIAVAQKRHELALLLLCALAAALLIDALGSPWVAGKGLATGSVAIPLGALVAAGWLLARHRATALRIAGATLGVLVVGGVVWSNVLGYHAVNLAPRQQMSELSYIGGRIAGQGPTFMDEFSAFAATHFLRDAAPDTASGIRARRDYLIDGHTLPAGDSADIDDFVLDGVLAYRTLVLQRSPTGSRPPSPYRLTYQDRFWQVWQRPVHVDPPVLYHLSFNTQTSLGIVPRCSAVLALARLPRVAELVADPVRNGVFVSVALGTHPASWSLGSSFLKLDGAGTATIPVSVGVGGRYKVWLGGSIRGPLRVFVDGHDVGEALNELQEPGQYVPFGVVTLRPGDHTVKLRYGGGDWRPGSGGPPSPIGPLVLTLAEPQPPLIHVPASKAASVCGRTLDWIEALGSRVSQR